MNKEIIFRYKNTGGEVSLVKIIPYGLIWHNAGLQGEKQWLLQGMDVDKNIEVYYILNNCNFVIME